MNIDTQVEDRTLYTWLRDIHRFKHTIAFDRSSGAANKESYGFFLDKRFLTRDGIYIGDKPEVQAIAAVWTATNQFCNILKEMTKQAEATCNVIAALDDVQTHDDVLDQETWDIVNNMLCHTRHREVLRFAITELKHVLDRTQQSAERVRGIYRGEQKEKIEDRLVNFLGEHEDMLRSFDETLEGFGLPQSAKQVREFVLSELIAQVEIALADIAPMRGQSKDAPLPGEMLQRIVDNEAILQRALSQLKEWRDNPNQKFGGKMKEMAVLLQATCCDMVSLKDLSYHAAAKLGLRFANRTGYM